MYQHFYRAPSMKRLLEMMRLTEEQATRVRDLLHGKTPPSAYKSVQEMDKAAYHPHPYAERLLVALNEVCETYGVEYISFSAVGRPQRSCINSAYAYLNAGDTYATTLVYNYETQTFRLSSWGDIVEKEGL